MRGCLGLVVLVACSAPAATQVIDNKPTGPAAPSCADIGVILRGEINSDDEAKAGPAREAAIASACETDSWPQTVIMCVASTARPQVCLDKLTDTQTTAYEARLQTWSDNYGVDTDDGDDGDYDVPPDDPYVACADAIGDVARYAPVVGENAPERDWIMKRRNAVLEHECDHGWSEPLKACLQAAPDATGVEKCVTSELESAERDELTKELTDIDKLAAKIAAARKKPTTITCKKVVAFHYGDKEWKTKLDSYKAAERKKMIADSRTKMTKACTADHWDESLRACIVAGGGNACFESFGMGMLWGYPAAGVVTSIGIADCDAYGAAVIKLTTCDKLPQSSRDALLQAFQQMQAHMAAAPADERAQMGTSCKAGLDAIKQIGSSVGC